MLYHKKISTYTKSSYCSQLFLNKLTIKKYRVTFNHNIKCMKEKSKERFSESISTSIRPFSNLPYTKQFEIKHSKKLGHWDALPSRYQLMIVTAISLTLCNMDKVNMSVAIIPMARDFGWSPTVSGLIQSSFFYGYALCQLPGGFLSSKFSGSRMLPTGVSLWSLATAILPLLANSMPSLCMARASVGLGESLAPAALTDMVARIVPAHERSRTVTFVGAGLYLGTILGLILSPILVESFGWESVFYIFGIVGLFWVLWWHKLINKISINDSDTFSILQNNHDANNILEDGIPWRAMIRSKSVQALIYVHFCNNWFSFTMLSWLPTFFTDTLNLDLIHAAQISLLPPIASMTAAFAAGPLADFLIHKGTKVGYVRKLMQSIAFLGPSFCLTTATFSQSTIETIGFITLALGLSSFSLAGLYCNHQDLSLKHASTLLGITNTAGAFPGIIGVAVTGSLLDYTGSWSLALFVPSIFFLITGTIAYMLYGSAEPLDFSNNKPFKIEDDVKLMFNKEKI